MPSSPAPSLLKKLAYPGTMLLAFGVAVALNHVTDLDILASAYVAAILGAGLVTLLEFVIPYKIEWQPRWPDVKSDLAFMVVVQLLLPQAFALAAVAIFARSGEAFELVAQQIGPYLFAAQHYWPFNWPVAAQVVLMLLSAELLRYWMHFAAHHTSFLWRLHAVHHSPNKLYWLNVGRFHPVEKALQYLLDALPFILLGVSENVLAYYFVFYSINGFFQHSNVDARYGALNYIVSSAELHRWHHSKLANESNRNYGNNLIVWDLIFGSWFLPSGRRVGDLGLLNPAYPQDFFRQMLTPLKAGLDQPQADADDA